MNLHLSAHTLLSILGAALVCGCPTADDESSSTNTSGEGGGLSTSSSAQGASGPGVGGMEAGSGAGPTGPSSGPGAGGSSAGGSSAGGSGSGGTGGTPCVPDCSATQCGPDPMCGSSCGTCSGQDACVQGQCECQPQCNQLQCGPDGCGASCGTCSEGQCQGGQCISECQNGETQCDGLGDQKLCVNGLWETQTCANYNVCVQGSCKPVCDSHLATQTNPSTCFFPISEGANQGLFMFTNDTTKLTLGTRVTAAVWDGVNDAGISSVNGTDWPWAFSMFGINQADVAAAQFKLTGFSPPVQQVWIHFRSRRTGLIQSSSTTRYNVAASNGSIFATATPVALFSWTTHSINVVSPYVQSFSPSNWNFMMVSPIGNGFGAVADHIQMSWFMLEVVD